MNTGVARINITLPQDLLLTLKREIPSGELSSFLVEAAKEKLAQKETHDAIKAILAGPPSFTHVKDSVAYVRKMRKLDEKRFKRLGL